VTSKIDSSSAAKRFETSEVDEPTSVIHLLTNSINFAK
jgi:hypothetical protein